MKTDANAAMLMMSILYVFETSNLKVAVVDSLTSKASGNGGTACTLVVDNICEINAGTGV